MYEERRTTLSHELVHDERRITEQILFSAREELAVDRIAARRLINLDRLIEVLCWTRHSNEVASELSVDVTMLAALVRSLSEQERRYIDAEMDRRQP